MFFVAVAILSLPLLSSALTTRADHIRWVDCARNVPEPLQGVQLPSVLPSTLKCGRLDVPLDYAYPISDGNRITIGFSVYRPRHPKGLINFNPGGPASEVSSFAWHIALNLSFAPAFEGLEEYEILAMDVRGTFSSNPLNCSIGSAILPSSLPSTQSEFDGYTSLASTFAQSCIANSTPSGIVAHVGTRETIQDWDRLRDALRYDKMHFLSWSYGTFGATAYAHKFPHRVGRFVLDGSYPHGISIQDLATFQIKAANRLLARADAYCLNDAACPFHSQGRGSIQNAFGAVLNLASRPGAHPTADDVRAVVALAYLSINPDFPALNLALHSALNGNWTMLSYDSFGPFYSSKLTVLAIICLDSHFENNTFAGFQAIRNHVAADDSANMQYSQDLSLLALCSGWPYHADSNVPLPVDAPMLVVTSDFDLNTPTEASDVQWQQAPNSALVVRHGDDHGTFFLPGPARSAEIEFLKTGELPHPRDEQLVTIYAPGSVRGPIADPYSVPTGPLAGDMTSIQ